MNAAEIERRRADVARRCGEWTAHNIHLGEGVYTLGPDIQADKLRRIVQIVADLGPRPIEELRILDLACLEGGYGVEFARRGAKVTVIEARDTNLEKVRLAKDVLALPNLAIVKDDVRNLSKDRYGSFDIVLCLGILYHLDAPYIFSFIHRIAEVCQSLTILDTYVGMSRNQRFEYNGHEYWGRIVREHREDSTGEERLANKWASLNNTTSVWISRSSLYNLLNDAGFTSAYECQLPTEVGKPADRVTIVAVRGRVQPLLAMPRLSEQPMARLPERLRAPTSRKQQLWPEIQERATNLVPLAWRRSIKARLRRMCANTR
jgi:hypothetical protein